MWLRVVVLVITALIVIISPLTHAVSVPHLTALRGISSAAYVTTAEDGVVIVGTDLDGKVVCLKVGYGFSVKWSLTLGKGRIVASTSPKDRYLALGVVGNTSTDVTVVNIHDGSILKPFTLHARVDEIRWVGDKYLVLVFEEGGVGHWELSIYNLEGGRVFTTTSLGLGFRLRQVLISGNTVVVLNSSLSHNARNAYAYVVGEGVRCLGGGIIALTLSPDGSLVAMLERSGGKAYLKVERVTDGYVILSKSLGNVSEGVVEFSRDGHYVAVAYGRGEGELLEVFSLSNGFLALRTKVLEGEPLVDFISWSPDSRYLLVRGAKGLEVLNLDGEVVLSKVIIGDVDEVFWFPRSGSVGLVVEDETMGYDYFMLLSLSNGAEFKAVNGGVIGEYFLSKPCVLGLVFRDGTVDIVFDNGNVTRVVGPDGWHAEYLLLRDCGNDSIQAIILYSSGESVSLGEVLTSIAYASTSASPRSASARNAGFDGLVAGLLVIAIIGIAFLVILSRK